MSDAARGHDTILHTFQLNCRTQLKEGFSHKARQVRVTKSNHFVEILWALENSHGRNINRMDRRDMESGGRLYRADGRLHELLRHADGGEA